MPYEERIFLEMKPAVALDLGGHMYLVKRTVFVQDGVVLNVYDPGNDRVIRGASGTLAGTDQLLGAYEMSLSASKDGYDAGETTELA